MKIIDILSVNASPIVSFWALKPAAVQLSSFSIVVERTQRSRASFLGENGQIWPFLQI
jgi:hypothetical protein